MDGHSEYEGNERCESDEDDDTLELKVHNQSIVPKVVNEHQKRSYASFSKKKQTCIRFGNLQI